MFEKLSPRQKEVASGLFARETRFKKQPKA